MRRALQPRGVGVKPLGVGGRRASEVLQLLDDGPQAVGVVAGGGVVGPQVGEPRLGADELREHPHLVGVEGVAQRRERLADAVGVLEQRELLGERRLLALCQCGGRELLGLVAQPLLVAVRRGGLVAQRRQAAAALLQAGVLRRIVGQ